MRIDPWILAFSAITVVVTLWMGFWSARKSRTASDFFVAGRSVSVGWNASAISGEYLSAASFMGVAGMVMSSGYDALWYPVCYACGYLFLLLFIAGPLRRFGAYTIPDFAEGRFDSPLFRKIAVVFVLCIGFFYTMPQMKGAGTTLNYIFPGLPYWAGVVLVCAVITLNVALGGMKGITLVQAFQYWAKMFAISVPVFVLMTVYGHYGKQMEANGPARTVPRMSVPFNSVQELEQTLSVATRRYEPLQMMKATFGLRASNALESVSKAESVLKHELGLNTLPIPLTNTTLENYRIAYSYFTDKSVHYRRSTNEQQRLAFNPGSTKSAAALATAIEAMLGTNGISIFSLNPTQALFATDAELRKLQASVPPPAGEPAMGVQRGALPAKAPPDATWIHPFGPLTTKAAKAAKLSAAETRPLSLLYTYSLIIALVCGTAGLPHILVRFYTNPDGAAAKRTTMWVMILIGVFYLFPPVFGVMGRNLMPELYNGLTGVEGTDGIVLKLPKLLNDRLGVLGSVLSGITCAGAFAAFMSTFSGLLVSMTGALAHDVYGRILRPQATSYERMRMFKVCAVVVGAGAMLLGFLVENFEINKMVGWAFAIAATSYFPLLFLSTWWRGMTMKGAATGMLIGGTLSLLAIASTMFADQAAWAAGLKAFYAGHPLVRILAEQPAIWALPLAITLMWTISKLTAREIPADIRMKMLVLHAPEQLGLKQEYIQEHGGH